MANFFSDFTFLQNSIYFGCFAAVLAGILGTLVMVNRLNYLSSGFSHSSLGGIGLAVFFGYNMPAMVILFALAVGFVITFLYNRNKSRLGAYIDLLSSFGMALGSILIQLSPGTPKDYSTFLFGSLLLVSSNEVWVVASLTIFLLGYVFFAYPSLVAVAFDRDYAQATGIRVQWVERLLILMLAFILPFLVRTLGLTLTLTLLAFSPLIFEAGAKSVAWLMVFATLTNFFFMLGGIFVAYYYDLPIGSAASLLAVAGFFAYFLAAGLKMQRAAY